MSKRRTTEQFIKEAQQLHGDKYDYSKTKYISCKDKIIIICPEHGEFEQRPEKHLLGSQCYFCGYKKLSKNKSKTTEQFITEARQVHRNIYIYDKSVYTGANNKLIITCKIHGDFEQTPNSHLQGSGCGNCSRKHSKILKTTEQFIIEASQIHGDKKYIYDKTKYIGSRDKLIITCPEHGDFEQISSVHLQGSGCPKCAIQKLSDNPNFKSEEKRLTTEEFIYRATLVHQDDYDYSKSNYKSSKEKVIITCPTHGDFEQNPIIIYQDKVVLYVEHLDKVKFPKQKKKYMKL